MTAAHLVVSDLVCPNAILVYAAAPLRSPYIVEAKREL